MSEPKSNFHTGKMKLVGKYDITMYLVVFFYGTINDMSCIWVLKKKNLHN